MGSSVDAIIIKLLNGAEIDKLVLRRHVASDDCLLVNALSLPASNKS